MNQHEFQFGLSVAFCELVLSELCGSFLWFLASFAVLCVFALCISEGFVAMT